MDELKINQFLLSAEDIQDIIKCASNGDKMVAREMTDINTGEAYLEVSKNDVVWGTYVFEK